MNFKKTTLKNGVRVVSEFHPHSHAVALGAWVVQGTRHEKPDQAGVSHFLEHLVFKGTKKRTALQIAKALEMVGGELNAYTTREYTVYHSLVLQEFWGKALDVVTDLVTNMRLKKSDFDTEKSVILQEIGMTDDELEELIFDEYFAHTLPKSTLGKPILGSLKSIAGMKMSMVQKYYRDNYSADKIIIAAAGNIDHSDFVAACEKLVGKLPGRKRQATFPKPRSKPVRLCVDKNSEQLHVCMGFPVTTYKDRERFTAFVANALLGGGMTSRLFQSVREKKGLVYTIYSALNTFEDFGCINIYAACEPDNMKPVLKTVVAELRKLRATKVKPAEVALFKTQVKGAILLGSDDVENRMTSIAVNEMVFGAYKSVQSVIDEIDAVTVESVNEFIKKYVNVDQLSVVVMGKEASKLQNLVEETLV